MANFKLGDKLRCRVTGFEGIAIARVEYLNGCVQYAVKPKVEKDGKMPAAEYVDSEQLEAVGAGEIAVTPRQTGGPATFALPRI